jgi:hypothetical protein
MAGGQNSLKISTSLQLIKIYQMRPLLAGSISLDNTFKVKNNFVMVIHTKHPSVYMTLTNV